MTRAELHRLVDRLPEIALDDGTCQVMPTRDDLQALNDTMIELGKRLGTLTIEWMMRHREWLES